MELIFWSLYKVLTLYAVLQVFSSDHFRVPFFHGWIFYPRVVKTEKEERIKKDHSQQTTESTDARSGLLSSTDLSFVHSHKENVSLLQGYVRSSCKICLILS